MKWSDLEESSHVHYVNIQRELVAEINDKGTVIGYTVLDHCKTPAGDRRLVLNSKAQDLFNTIRTLNIQNGIPVGENDYVFMRIRKKLLQLCNHKVFDSRIRVYCRHSGMSEAKSFHDIRRTVLTNLYYAGMPLKDIQKFAGHTSLQQAMDYIKIKEDDISTLSYLETLSTSKMDSKSDENDPKAVFKVA